MKKKSEKPGKKTVRMHLSGTQNPISDLSGLRKLTDRKIQNAINRDPDAASILIDWPKDAKVVMSKRKVAISLRVDPEVLEFYKHQGSAHLSLMNAVLKAYMQSQQHGLHQR
jgi:uncharacterized protein (DUF4415 family)